VLSGHHRVLSIRQLRGQGWRKLARPRHGEMGAVQAAGVSAARAGLLDGHRHLVQLVLRGRLCRRFSELDATEDVLALSGRPDDRFGCGGGPLICRCILTAEGRAVTWPPKSPVGFQAPSLVRGQGSPAQKPTFASTSTNDNAADVIPRQAVALFRQNIEDPINIADVAEGGRCFGGVSWSAQFLRKATGKTPFIITRRLRMHKARQTPVLQARQTDADRRFAVGYVTSFGMAQDYVDVFGISAAGGRKKVQRCSGWRENAHHAPRLGG